MFSKLQTKWKVSGTQLLLVLITFALGGSLCGYAGRKLLGLFSIEQRWLWVLLYIILIGLLWPICVLLISVPLGQYGFFKKYVSRIGRKMFGGQEVKETERREDGSQELGKMEVWNSEKQGIEGTGSRKVAIFASGAGSNARKIIESFKGTGNEVVLIICNKPGAGVFDIAKDHNIPTLLIDKTGFFSEGSCIEAVRSCKADLLVLAGFLWKLPPSLVQAFPGRILNIHPALLPKYGGKGMYGSHVHEAVIAAGEKESGITIHYVDELYDHGSTIFQASCPVSENETAESLANKIHQLEHEHYPRVIREILEARALS